MDSNPVLYNLPISREQLHHEYPILYNIYDDFDDVEFVWLSSLDNHILLLMYGNLLIDYDEDFDN